MTPEEEEAAMIAKMMNGELEDVAPKSAFGALLDLQSLNALWILP